MLRQADAAFVGRLVDATADRWIFSVDESVKGDLGPQVQLRRADVGGWFTPQPGVQTGLVVDRGEDGVLSTTDCGRLTPAQLRAAANAPEVTCLRPRGSHRPRLARHAPARGRRLGPGAAGRR
jgi:hypothetical protein